MAKWRRGGRNARRGLRGWWLVEGLGQEPGEGAEAAAEAGEAGEAQVSEPPAGEQPAGEAEQVVKADGADDGG